MKICPRLLIFELSECTLRIFRGYEFSVFLILLFLDRYFGVFDSDLLGPIMARYNFLNGHLQRQRYQNTVRIKLNVGRR